MKAFFRGEAAGGEAIAGNTDDPRGAGLFATSAWFGTVAGLLELGTRLAVRSWDDRVTLATIRTNWHWAWMVPVSEVALFAACGLLLTLLARRRPRPVRAAAPYLLCGLAAMAVLLAIEGLHPAACVVLACGLATRLAPAIASRPSGFRRLVRRTSPALAAAVAGLIGVVGTDVSLAERRARAQLPRPTPGAPNVLLVVLDNVRVDDLSLYGYDRDTSPNLERLARRAYRFDRARATAPWTLPSHASMFTGRWPHRLSTAVDRPLDDACPTLAEYLAGHGYDTAGFVANTFYCNAWYGLGRGFAHYEDFRANRAVSPLEVLRSGSIGRRLVAAAGLEAESPGALGTRKTAATLNRDALAWLSSGDRDQDRPFLAFLNYYDAHAPFQPPDGPGRRRHYGLDARPAAFRKAILRDYARISDGRSPSGGADARAAIGQAATLMRDAYDGCIAYLDDQLGRLVDDLDRRGLLANTLVIVTSDHGEHFGDRDLFGHGHSLYRPLLHVPLLILPPAGVGTDGERVVRRPVSLRDLPATVVDLLGLPGRSPFPGHSLARHWSNDPDLDPDPGPTPGEPLLAEVEHQTCFPPSAHIPASLGPLQSLVADAHVYIRNSDGREELYDLESDPGERHNLAAVGAPSPPAVLGRLRRDLSLLLRE